MQTHCARRIMRDMTRFRYLAVVSCSCSRSIDGTSGYADEEVVDREALGLYEELSKEALQKPKLGRWESRPCRSFSIDKLTRLKAVFEVVSAKDTVREMV
jgi:hypothetical protein